MVPFDVLRRHPVMATTVSGVSAVVLFDPRVLSPLDAATIAGSRTVGAASAFDQRLGGRTLGFRSATAGLMTDAQTGSLWDITGHAIGGPLAASSYAASRT